MALNPIKTAGQLGKKRVFQIANGNAAKKYMNDPFIFLILIVLLAFSTLLSRRLSLCLKLSVFNKLYDLPKT